MRTGLIAICMALGLGIAAEARDFYVAPAGAPGSETAIGSRDDPFASVRQALRSDLVSGGDRILLLDGTHGAISVQNVDFSPPVEIVAAEPGRAHAERLTLKRASGLRFAGLAIWPLGDAPSEGRLVATSKDSRDIGFDRLDIRGRADAPDTYLSWSKDDWLAVKANGVRLDGPGNQITRSSITGVRFGITTTGDDAKVLGNRISGFGGDAMRGLGDRSVFSGNVVRDCVTISDNHDDGFQSWASKKRADGRKVLRGLLLEGNVILEWTGPAAHPLRCRLQGIGLFDGTYEDVTIRNNLVAVSAWHGISLYEGDESRIINNTVVHPSGAPAELPWIMLGQKKKGRAPGDVVVSNNVAMAYRGVSMPMARNVRALFPEQLFADPTALDFRPLKDGPLVDAGHAASAPRRDILGGSRDGRPDMGAFELR